VDKEDGLLLFEQAEGGCVPFFLQPFSWGIQAYSVVDLELSNRLSELVCRDPAKPFLTPFRYGNGEKAGGHAARLKLIHCANRSRLLLRRQNCR
jgi:hypothetical protein